MLRPTMLPYVALACCDRLAGALCRYIASVNQLLPKMKIQLYTHRVRLILDIVRIQTFEQNHKDPQMKLKISFHFWSRLKRGKNKTIKTRRVTTDKRSIKSTKKSTTSQENRRIKYPRSAYRGIHADVIDYIFAHLHTTLRTEGNMLDTN